MYLKSVKLAGFKSFVDPTSVAVRSNMSAVVGPNGCGKSNIVDAIRWVIGEASAKKLRGQLMSDVIFNGTSTRKPVGRAMVELHFDNSAGRIVGEYAQYSDLLIRREVERDGQSSYFLNGSHCRRRDILDIFLGTGLGSRSYSIIEQGMISQLVEAKPDEMRVHFEEVAGISKYKERRRETENRISHTQENLDRLNDIREELSKQLRHLKRQANAAERFKEYKKEEQLLSAQIKALIWQSLEEKRSQQQELIRAAEIRHQQKIADQRQNEANTDKAQLIFDEAQQQYQEVQQHFYQLGEAIARLEQQIKHHQDQMHSWQKELADTEVLWQELGDSSYEQSAQVKDLEAELDSLAPQFGSVGDVVTEANLALTEAEASLQAWQQKWDAFQQSAATLESQVKVAQANVEHKKQQLQQMHERQQLISTRLLELPINDVRARLSPLEEQVAAVAESQADAKNQLDDYQQQLQQLRERIKVCRQDESDERRHLQKLEAEQTRLAALQRVALGGDARSGSDWLKQNSLADYPRLGQALRVKAGWESAVETVMSGYFDAVCVDTLIDHAAELSKLTDGRVTLVEKSSTLEQSPADNSTKLLAHVESDWPFDHWLHAIYVADTFEAALEMRSRLSQQESVITKDCIWMGKNWIRVCKTDDPQSGVLERERQLQDLEAKVIQARDRLSQLEHDHQVFEANLAELEESRELLQQGFQQMTSERANLQSQLSSQQAKLENLLSEESRLKLEVEESHNQVLHEQQSLHTIENQRDSLREQQQVLIEQRDQLIMGRESCQRELAVKREQAQHHKQQADELQVRIGANESQLALLRQTIARNEKQLGQLAEKRAFLTVNLSQENSPSDQLNSDLQLKLEERFSVEQALQSHQQQLAEVRAELKTLDAAKQQALDEITSIQSELEKHRLSGHEVLVRQQTLKEQLQADNISLEQTCQALSSEANLNEWEQKLEVVGQRIQRLGPINLAAIDEFDSCSERKVYLDKQLEDLTESLDTLQAAIKKMDRETQSRFRATFDKVNKGFQETFPRIFGGGRASLELSDEDLLTTGILVKAQPPGKRNSTIHMLSGGEKALTAISLVFAMFRLNPAPFCILDEVDAPLDDLNVNRFCQLVKEMSQETQFLIISHNKVTIEMADHLLGVTMQEPGVSRLVAVDMDQALELVET